MPTAVTAIIVQLVLAAVGSYVASRLLGIRVTWGRWIVALAAGVVLGGITAWVLAGRPLDGAGIEPDVVLVATFLITLTAVADPFGFAGPPGRLARVSAGLVRIPRLWRGIRDRLVRSRRYAQVVHIAARHGLLDQADDTATVGDPAHAAAADQRHLRRVGRALRATLEDAGGAFVKLGQVLSTRPDLLPEQITTELTGLTDDVAPSPAEQIAALLAGEYDAPPQQVFTEFDADPVAAASIAQVHHARLRTGEPVAVKVQRPQIRSVVARDLDITRRLAGAIEHRGDWGRDVGVVDSPTASPPRWPRSSTSPSRRATPPHAATASSPLRSCASPLCTRPCRQTGCSCSTGWTASPCVPPARSSPDTASTGPSSHASC